MFCSRRTRLLCPFSLMILTEWDFIIAPKTLSFQWTGTTPGRYCVQYEARNIDELAYRDMDQMECFIGKGQFDCCCTDWGKEGDSERGIRARQLYVTWHALFHNIPFVFRAELTLERIVLVIIWVSLDQSLVYFLGCRGLLFLCFKELEEQIETSTEQSLK